LSQRLISPLVKLLLKPEIVKMAENSDYVQLLENNGYPFVVLFGKYTQNTEEDVANLKKAIRLLDTLIPNSVLSTLEEDKLVLNIILKGYPKEMVQSGGSRQES